MARRAVFIVFEGPDKCGKSTQAAMLARRLRSRGLRVVHTREPGGTSLAEAVRSILLDRRNKVHDLAELLLYEAARAQHTHEKIIPALRSGAVVVSERYAMATLAYQGCGRGIPMPVVRALNAVATGGLRPDLTIVLDIPDREFARRDAARRLDRLEAESAAFRRKVRLGYLRLSRTEPATVVLDGCREPAEVHADALRLAGEVLAGRRPRSSPGGLRRASARRAAH